MNGGVNALYGFRYQMLRTMERILQLYLESPEEDWEIEVESATDEKVDYAEYRNGTLERVVQVKASRAGSSTRIGLTEISSILQGFSKKYPGAREFSIEASREGQWTEITNWCLSASKIAMPNFTAMQDSRSLAEVDSEITSRIRKIRINQLSASDPVVATRLSAILEAHLWKLGTLVTSSTGRANKRITTTTVDRLITLNGQPLAEALGSNTWNTFWNVPNGDKVRRDSIEGFLQASLKTSQISLGKTNNAAIVGFAGLGKTSAAISWAENHSELYAIVILANAATPATLAADIKEMLRIEYGRLVNEWDVSDIRNYFIQYMETTPRTWLLILDNANDSTDTRKWIPARGFGHIIITSRKSNWPTDLNKVHHIGPMDSHEVRTMIEARLQEPVTDQVAFDRLLSVTEKWPLAIEMVAGWLYQTGRSVASVEKFSNSAGRQILLDNPSFKPTEYPETVVATILSVLAEIQERVSIAWEILAIGSFLGGESIPTALFNRLAVTGNTDLSAETSMEVESAIAALRNYSVIETFEMPTQEQDEWSHRFNIHNFISDLTVTIGEFNQQTWVDTLNLLNDVVSSSINDRNIHLASTFTAIVEGVNRRIIGNSLPYSPSILMALGNIAAITDLNGDPVRAMELYAHEFHLADSIRRSSDDDAAQHISAYLATVAKIQAAAIGARIDRPTVAVQLLQEVIVSFDSFKASVGSDAFREYCTLAYDTLTSITDPQLKPEIGNLLTSLEDKGADISLSNLQRAEVALRDDDFDRAIDFARADLDTAVDPIVRMQAFGVLAEAFATDDQSQSDQMLSQCARVADHHGMGESLVLRVANHVAHRRALNLCVELEKSEGSFSIDHLNGLFLEPYLLMSSLPTSLTWRDVLGVQLTTSWHAIVTERSDAYIRVDNLLSHFDDPDPGVPQNEVDANYALAVMTKLALILSSKDRTIKVDRLFRKGNSIFAPIGPNDFGAFLSNIAVGPYGTMIVGWNLLVLVQDYCLWIELRGPSPIDNTTSPFELLVVPDSAVDRGAISLDLVAPLGTVDLKFDLLAQRVRQGC